jgi:hypothetical protein
MADTKTTVLKSCRVLWEDLSREYTITVVLFLHSLNPIHPNSSSVAPADMAQQSALLKEDQLRREEEKLKEIEMRVQREILQRKQELSESLTLQYYRAYTKYVDGSTVAKEDSLKALEARLGKWSAVTVGRP